MKIVNDYEKQSSAVSNESIGDYMIYAANMTFTLLNSEMYSQLLLYTYACAECWMHPSRLMQKVGDNS